MRRTCFYLRDQQCAGSKDCNDTVCTLFEALSHRWTPFCAQPKLYRSGYEISEVSSTAQTLLTAQDMSKGMAGSVAGGSVQGAIEDATADSLLSILVDERGDEAGDLTETARDAPPQEESTASVHLSARIPQPFIRRTRHQLDASGATNRNHMVKEGVATAVAADCMDVAQGTHDAASGI